MEVFDLGEPVVQQLRINANLNAIKKSNELVTRSLKGLTCKQSSFIDAMCVRIMARETAKEALDRFNEEFEQTKIY